MTSASTTKLNLDQSILRDRIRRLARLEVSDAPILSVYLDLRPQGGGGNPAVRPALVMLRDRMRDLERALPAHGTAAESFATDRQRIERHVESDEARPLAGLAVHACAARDVWELTPAHVAFETQISAGPTADLFQLARLLDEHETAVVAILDTNTARLFVTRRGNLFERAGPDEGPEEHTLHDQGGWAQARFQRHIGEQDRRFAAEAAAAIERLVNREAARRLILAGDERAISVLDEQLPETVRNLVIHVERIDIEAARRDVEAGVAPLLAAIEEDSGKTVADRALAGIRSGGLGVGGIEPVMRALEMGQVHELVIDEGQPTDEELRAELVRQAALTDARLEVVDGHPGLDRFDGVVATLRFLL